MSETHNHTQQIFNNAEQTPMFVLPQVQQARGGLTVVDLYGLLFVALKLAGIIGWSWFFVLAPLWVPAAFAVVSFFGRRVIARKIAKRKAVRW